MRTRLLIGVVVAGLGGCRSAGPGREDDDRGRWRRPWGPQTCNSIQFSGRGSDYIFGQPYDPNSPWPRFNLPAFTTTIDYATPALRDDLEARAGREPAARRRHPAAGRRDAADLDPGAARTPGTSWTRTPAGRA